LAPSLAVLPASLFGAVMGLAGFGLACRAAAALFPVPAGFAEIWIGLAAVAWLLLLPAYAAKALRHPQAVKEELANPALLGYCATLPVGSFLLAAGLQPWAEAPAQALWWAAVAVMLVLQLRMLQRLMLGGIKLAQVNGGWMILLVGGIVAPSAGLPLGHDATALALFAFSAAVSPLVMGLVLVRMLFGPPLPDAAKPSWFIVLVPPALIYLNGSALAGGPAGTPLEVLFLCGLPLAVALLVASRGLLRWPFGPPWWAFTFPLDAMAAAAVRFAQEHPGAGWRAVAGALLVVTGIFVTWTLSRTLLALASKKT